MTPRQIAGDVLLEALGSSATPFVPVPWVDDWLLARLLRRIAKKALVRHGVDPAESLCNALVAGFVDAGTDPFAQRAAVGAVRFIVRKVAVVLDVKKGHDVFGRAIAFALALDAAIGRGALQSWPPQEVGKVLHRALSSVGSAPIVGLAGTVRGAESVADAVGTHIDRAHARLAAAVEHELHARR
jgi:hypothetical protein